jgi:hypothetical protein
VFTGEDADAVEPVVVAVAVGQPGVTTTGAALAAVGGAPAGQRIQPDAARAGLCALGELLAGVTQRPLLAETADRFTARSLGAADAGQLIDED